MTQRRESLMDDFSYQTAKIYGKRGLIIKGARFGSERVGERVRTLSFSLYTVTSREVWHPGIIFLSFTHSLNPTCMLKRDSETSTGFQSWLGEPVVQGRRDRADYSFLTPDL